MSILDSLAWGYRGKVLVGDLRVEIAAFCGRM
jgi:hypothetical protein